MSYESAIPVSNITGNRKALCVVVDTKGSTPRKIGAKMWVNENGQIKGSIGGGSLEKQVIKDALNQINKGEPKLFKHDLLHEHSMCCGGTVYIYIEPEMPKSRLYIFGAGHTGEALAKLAIPIGFEVYVIDDRSEYLDALKIDGINKMNIDHREVLSVLPFDQHTFIAIMTYDHAIDRDILNYCINQPHAYLGMIGSKRKVEITKKKFTEGKLATKKQLNQVDMPMGLKIKAEDPYEIAVSILAKLIEVKNGK